MKYLLKFENGTIVPGAVENAQSGEAYAFRSDHNGFYVGILRYDCTFHNHVLDCGRISFFVWRNPKSKISKVWQVGGLAHCRKSLTLSASQ